MSVLTCDPINLLGKKKSVAFLCCTVLSCLPLRIVLYPAVAYISVFLTGNHSHLIPVVTEAKAFVLARLWLGHILAKDIWTREPEIWTLVGFWEPYSCIYPKWLSSLLLLSMTVCPDQSSFFCSFLWFGACFYVCFKRGGLWFHHLWGVLEAFPYRYQGIRRGLWNGSVGTATPRQVWWPEFGPRTHMAEGEKRPPQAWHAWVLSDDIRLDRISRSGSNGLAV